MDLVFQAQTPQNTYILPITRETPSKTAQTVHTQAWIHHILA